MVERYASANFNSIIFEAIQSIDENIIKVKESILPYATPFGTLFTNDTEFIQRIALYTFNTNEKYKDAILSSKLNYLFFDDNGKINLNDEVILKILNESKFKEDVLIQSKQFYLLFTTALNEVPCLLQSALLEYIEKLESMKNAKNFFLYWDVLMRLIVYNYKNSEDVLYQGIVKRSIDYTTIATNLCITYFEKSYSEFAKEIFMPILECQNIPKEICYIII